jgi:hypothetical protein
MLIESAWAIEMRASVSARVTGCPSCQGWKEIVNLHQNAPKMPPELRLIGQNDVCAPEKPSGIKACVHLKPMGQQRQSIAIISLAEKKMKKCEKNEAWSGICIEAADLFRMACSGRPWTGNAG